MPSERLIKDFMCPLDRYSYIKLMGQTAGAGSHPCLIVVGEEPSEKDIIKGFVTPTEIVFGLAGHFLKGAQKSGPIFWEGQFEAECLEGAKKRVGEIMFPIKCARQRDAHGGRFPAQQISGRFSSRREEGGCGGYDSS
jgi:hypothetical protein